MKINIKKLSEISGYSIATVSNALNKKRGVNAETAKKIICLAEQYGYVTENKIDNICLVAYRDSGRVLSNSPFFATLMESVENESRRNGFGTKLVNLYRQSPDYEQEVVRILEDTSSAILLVGSELSAIEARRFQNSGSPLVLLDCSFSQPAFQAVLMENEESVYQMACYLIELGHKKIGYLRGNVRTQNFKKRYRGYQRAMLDHNLPIDSSFIMDMPISINEAYESFASVLESQMKLPTAFMADNDMIALGTMQALQEKGVGVPDDISLTGFDDISFSEVITPGLTTVRVLKKELGQAAVRRLIDLINEPHQAKSCIQIYNELIKRGSVAAPHK